jgi:hypothetical protein
MNLGFNGPHQLQYPWQLVLSPAYKVSLLLLFFLLANLAWSHLVLGLLMDIQVRVLQVKSESFYDFRFQWTPSIAIAPQFQ